MSKTLIGKTLLKLTDATVKVGERDGTQVEKGVVLNEAYLESNFTHLGDIMSIFTAYPDIYLDTIRPADSSFGLFFY